MSLTQTLAQIRGSNSVRKVQTEHPLRLITTVQNVALVTVPGLIGNMVSLKAMLEGSRKPTVTDVGELSDQVQGILQQLQGEATWHS
jgi:hypothetical protein